MCKVGTLAETRCSLTLSSSLPLPGSFDRSKSRKLPRYQLKIVFTKHQNFEVYNKGLLYLRSFRISILFWQTDSLVLLAPTMSLMNVGQFLGHSYLRILMERIFLVAFWKMVDEIRTHLDKDYVELVQIDFFFAQSWFVRGILNYEADDIFFDRFQIKINRLNLNFKNVNSL